MNIKVNYKHLFLIIFIFMIVIVCYNFNKHKEFFSNQITNQNNNDMIILINAYNYPDIATERLLKSLELFNLKILIVGYGPDIRLNKINSNTYHLQTIQNSIDYTALIAVIEHQLLLKENNLIPKSWFYIHNTTEFGKKFKVQLLEAKTQPLVDFPSMNIGTYLHTDLLQHISFLKEVRSTDHPSKIELLQLKDKGFGYEDSLFKRIGTSGVYNQTRIINSPQHIYSDKTLRRVEYYPDLDFYKYKSNWGQHNNVNPPTLELFN